MSEKIYFTEAPDPNIWSVQNPNFVGRVNITVECGWRLWTSSPAEAAKRKKMELELNRLAKTYESEIALRIAEYCNGLAP